MTKATEYFDMARNYGSSYITSLITTMILETRGIDVSDRKDADEKHLQLIQRMITLGVEEEKNDI